MNSQRPLATLLESLQRKERHDKRCQPDYPARSELPKEDEESEGNRGPLSQYPESTLQVSERA